MEVIKKGRNKGKMAFVYNLFVLQKISNPKIILWNFGIISHNKIC